MLLYQLLRENVFASAFCFGGSKGKTSSDIIPLYLDKYKTYKEPPITKEDQDELEAEMKAINAAHAKKEGE